MSALPYGVIDVGDEHLIMRCPICDKATTTPLKDTDMSRDVLATVFSQHLTKDHSDHKDSPMKLLGKALAAIVVVSMILLISAITVGGLVWLAQWIWTGILT